MRYEYHPIKKHMTYTQVINLIFKFSVSTFMMAAVLVAGWFLIFMPHASYYIGDYVFHIIDLPVPLAGETMRFGNTILIDNNLSRGQTDRTCQHEACHQMIDDNNIDITSKQHEEICNLFEYDLDFWECRELMERIE